MAARFFPGHILFLPYYGATKKIAHKIGSMGPQQTVSKTHPVHTRDHCQDYEHQPPKGYSDSITDAWKAKGSRNPPEE